MKTLFEVKQDLKNQIRYYKKELKNFKDENTSISKGGFFQESAKYEMKRSIETTIAHLEGFYDLIKYVRKLK